MSARAIYQAGGSILSRGSTLPTKPSILATLAAIFSPVSRKYVRDYNRGKTTSTSSPTTRTAGEMRHVLDLGGVGGQHHVAQQRLLRMNQIRGRCAQKEAILWT